MGLVRGMARTAVVAGTATAVSNRVSRRQAARWQQQEYQEPAYAAPPPQTYAPAPPQAYTPPPASAAGGDIAADLERLAGLRSQGLLSDEEFAAAKAQLLSQS